ncbi:MAG TPA: hypothetical protein VIM70_01550 [Clostridium sp.]|uniref:hypothetical protein n=1 Tax=Clostridium sp. TaxID=1506 RepID=UPI002F94B0F4
MSLEEKETKTKDAILPVELNKPDSDIIMFFEPMELSVPKQLDKEEFIRGIKEASCACGMYTALINCGWSMEDSVAYIFNKMNIENNIKISEISANGSIEVSKHVSNAKDNSEL